MGILYEVSDGVIDRLKHRLAVNHNKTEAILRKYGEIAVSKLSAQTPKDSGITASSWKYEIVRLNGELDLKISNSSMAAGDSLPVIKLIKYGHATRSGGWVPANDFITPIQREVLKGISSELNLDIVGDD